MKIAILHTYSRNDSISIGALVIKDELERKGYTVDICDYVTAFNYTHVLVSMTATDDIFHIYAGCKKHNWNKRTFTAFVGGFGCQNPIALANYIDFAFFGRIDGIIDELLSNPYKFDKYCFEIKNPHKIELRQVNECYPYELRYGKNQGKWQEKIIGCPFRCKFCHYSHNRKYVGNGGYQNDQLSSSPEVMLKDIINLTEKHGRLTAALDGHSERLRFMWGKKITWDMVEEALDHLASFKGNTYFKMYNITNFPTETEADRQEFFEFFTEYVSCSNKPDGLLTIDVFNTAFRPSLNTPMERMPAKLFPEARQEIPEIAKGNGFNFKFTHLTKGAWEHLKDLISIRYTDVEHIDFVSNIRGNGLDEFVNKFDITSYIREYQTTDHIPFKLIK